MRGPDPDPLPGCTHPNPSLAPAADRYTRQRALRQRSEQPTGPDGREVLPPVARRCRSARVPDGGACPPDEGSQGQPPPSVLAPPDRTRDPGESTPVSMYTRTNTPAAPGGGDQKRASAIFRPGACTGVDPAARHAAQAVPGDDPAVGPWTTVPRGRATLPGCTLARPPARGTLLLAPGSAGTSPPRHG